MALTEVALSTLLPGSRTSIMLSHERTGVPLLDGTSAERVPAVGTNGGVGRDVARAQATTADVISNRT